LKRLDNYEEVRKQISCAGISALLFPDELRQHQEMLAETRDRKLAAICAAPLRDSEWSVVNTVYFRLKWTSVFEAFGAGGDFSLIEVGAGATATVPETMAVYAAKNHGSPSYVTLNMNKYLTQAFLRNTAGLSIKAEVVEDDAMNVKNHIAPGSVDIVAFQHSVNDVLQAILAEKNGLDTARLDWMGILPDMIRLINRAYESRALEQEAKEPFLRLVQNCADVLKPGGILAMSHYMFQYDLDLGYNPELWRDMIPAVRPWLDELTGGREIFYDGFDPQWWYFWKKR